MGDRLLLAARKSRKPRKDDAEAQAEDTRYERQDFRAKRWAEEKGHTVVHATADTVSSQTAPWKRKQLGPWMTDPAKMAMYDGILISDTDRISRGTQEDFVFIEHWATVNGKRIVVARGPQYPARTDAERGDWDGQKRRARTYWEDVRDKHADTRELIRENGGFIGRPNFGYLTSGPELRKTLVPHPENAPLAREMFQRIADGQPGTTVAAWLSAGLGRSVRVKFVLDCIRNRTYLGERDGAEFEPLVSRELWDAASAAVAARSFTRPAAKAVHGYSGVIFCDRCHTVLYRHYTGRGREVYRCGLGRRGVTEERCTMPGLGFDAVNAAVGGIMAALLIPEQVQRADGGDQGKAAELTAIKRQMNAALAVNDMPEVARLSVAYSERDAREAAPVRVWWEATGRTLGELWRAGDLAARRELLREGLRPHGYAMTVNADSSAALADIAEPPDVRPR